MQSIESVRRQIKSIKVISKITNAMKIISIAKITKAKNSFLAASEFSKEVYTSFYPIINEMEQKDLVNDSKRTL
jgi:F0F1-type ATP synthase gamma subunit